MTTRGLTHAPSGHGGLTPQEQAIMGEWDRGGASMRTIARRLALPFDTVRRTVTYYDGTADHAQFCRATQRASTRLADAIASAFPERTPA